MANGSAAPISAIPQPIQPPSNVVTVSLTIGVKKNPEFNKKQLATHSANIGLLCGHGCKYCSTAAMVRTHKIFKTFGQNSFQAFNQGVAIVDPNMPSKILPGCKRLKPTDTVILVTTTDAWAPEAQHYNLGRRCLEVLLLNSQAKIRILTKNAAITKDYDLISQYASRIELSLSITAPPKKAHLAKILEPNASPIAERINALKLAHEKGIKIYGMLCPCLPGIIDTVQDFEDLLDTVLPFNPVTIWTEPVNRRGDNLLKCRDELLKNNEPLAAQAIDGIRKKINYTAYTNKFIDLAIAGATNKNCINRLKILMYEKRHGKYANHPALIWLK